MHWESVMGCTGKECTEIRGMSGVSVALAQASAQGVPLQ